MKFILLLKVGDWLEAQGLGVYRQVFLDNDINGENLLELGKVRYMIV
jgi:hypothetical protein